MSTSHALTAGFASVDITPEPGATLFGYGFRAAGYDCIHAPLLARACVLHDGTTPAALVTLDHCVIPHDEAAALRAAIAGQIATDPGRVIVAATHTHSGPEPEAAYHAAIRERVVDAAKRAAGLRVPVVARFREAPFGLAYNRRVTQGNATSATDAPAVRHCWGTEEWPGRIPTVTPDPTCSVLELAQTNGDRRYVLWNLGAHPVVLGKTSRALSPDYPGIANAAIEATLPGSRALFTLGAAGNAQPWISTEERTDHVDLVGRAAGSFVSMLRHGAPALTADSAEDGLILRSAARDIAIGDTTLALTAWRLGNLRIIALPVELVAELGLALRQRLPGPLFLITVANGWHGYWCTTRQWAEGAYEVDVARQFGLAAGSGETLVDAAVALAQEIDATCDTYARR